MKRKPRSKPETVKVGNVTVSIYKRERPTAIGKRRTIFEVADYTSGIRKFRGFSDYAEARKEAEKIARQLSTGDATAAAMRNSDAASYGRSVELIRHTGAALELAASVYAKCFEILGGDYAIEAARFFKRHRADQVTKKRVADVVTELITAKEARGKSVRYVGDLRSRLTRFSEAFVVDISTVTTADVQRYLDGLKLAPQTAKNFRTVLHTLFAFAESRGYVFKGGNPVVDTESIAANGGAIEVFTPKEVAALLKSALTFRPVIFLAAFAGLRTAEIERIEWKDIDLTENSIHVTRENAKTRSRRTVPILPNLAAWLKPYAEKTGRVWKGTLTEMKEERAEAVKSAKYAWKDNGMRHSFISYRLAEIQNAAQVALEAGNSEDVIFRHYRQLVKPDQAKAWFAVMPASGD